MFYRFSKFNLKTVSQQLWSIITVKVTCTTISPSRPRCRLICSSVYVLLRYNVPHVIKLTSPSLFYFTASNMFNRITVSQPLWNIITVKVIFTSISATRPRCRLIRPSVYVSLTYNFPHIFKWTSPSFVLFYRFNKFNGKTVPQQLWSIIIVKVTYSTIPPSRPRFRLLRPFVYILLTYSIPHIFKLTTPLFVLLY